jgi:prepilin signal peptidase PulO-like enzyme (type II secretory pathway)
MLAQGGLAGAARREVAESLDARVAIEQAPMQHARNGVDGPDGPEPIAAGFAAAESARPVNVSPGATETVSDKAGIDGSAPPDVAPAELAPGDSFVPLDAATVATEQPRGAITGLAVATVSLLAIVGYALLVSEPQWQSSPIGSFAARAAIVFGLIYAVLIAASARRRAADTSIAHAIEQERFTARQMILGELIYLLPVVAGAAALGLWAARVPAIAQGWERWLAFEVLGRAPLAGLTEALRALLIAGGIAWTIRIGFTLVLGKEALGFGDVHILAAAGAVTGWVVVALGFFAAALLAVIGVVLLLAFKRSRAIPFGPWLALGILLTTITLDRALEFLRPAVQAWRQLLTG